MKQAQQVRVRLAVFELDLRTGELRSGDQKTVLQEQPLQILRMLVEREGELLAREDIRKRLWPNDTIVEFDHSINAAIKNLRRALGDSADEPKYIETLARRGYRLMVPVEWPAPGESPAEVPAAGDGAAVRLQPEPGLLGQKVSHYRVLEIIGVGGMGLVYKAEDLKLGRQVALKFLPEDLVRDPVALQRFEREAQTASSLNHPNICTIYEVEEHEAKPFIVMELLEGETLRDRLARATDASQTLPVDQVVNIGVQICAGLQAAHEKGIVHRDIKPANLFLTASGQVKILDFGIAKLTSVTEPPSLLSDRTENGNPPAVATAAPAGTLTRTGPAMGTAGYMSPEQVRGEKLDARTDIFSFGLVLYEMATGQRAFSGETAAVVYEAIVNDTAVPVRQLNPTLPAKLLAVIDHALEKDPERRYQSAAEMRADLTAATSNPLAATRSGRRKARLIVMAAVIAAFVAAASLGVYKLLHKNPLLPDTRNLTMRPLTEQDTIVLAGWENKTSDPVFYDALTFALLVDLYQSPYLNILAHGKMGRELKLMGHSGIGWPTSKPVTFDLAKQVCLRTNSTAVLGASISDRGNGYHLALRAVSCQSGALLASSEAEAVDRGAIVKTLGALVFLMRARLGEPEDSLRKFNAPLEQAASPSLEALQALEQSFNSQKLTDQIALVRRAVEIDPNFAWGYWILGEALTNAAAMDLGSDSAAQSYTKAFNLRDRVDQVTRYRIEHSYYADVTGELNKAEQVLLQWLQQYPRDRFDTTLVPSLMHLHRTMGKWEASASEAEELRRDSPDTAAYYANVIMCNSALGRLNEARSASEQAQARGLDGGFLRRQRYNLAFLLNDRAGMQEQVARAERERPEILLDILWMQSDTEAFYGHSRRARKLSERAIGLALRAGDKERAASYGAELALREAEIGNTNAALGFAQDALTLHKIPGAEILGAVALARTGRGEEAQKLADEVNRNHPLDDAIQNNWLPSIFAAANLGTDPHAGIRRLDHAYPYELGDVSFGTETFGRLYPVYMRGLCYLEARQPQQAAAEFQKILDHYGVVGNFIIGALSHLQLARAQMMMGDREAARKSYQDFLALWKDADPDIPIYRQAKAEYAKLK